MENEVGLLVLNDPIHDSMNFSAQWEAPDVDFLTLEDDFFHVFGQSELPFGDESFLAVNQPPEEENLDDILAELLEDFKGGEETNGSPELLGSSTDAFLNDEMFLITPAESSGAGFSCQVVTPLATLPESNILDLAITMPAKKRRRVGNGKLKEKRKWVVDDLIECEDDDQNDDDRIYDEQTRIDCGQLLNCKNLFSERNRRKRLNQQLLVLRSLVPNITKMDKRSVLIDALSYLKNIQEQTERMKSKLEDNQTETFPPKKKSSSKPISSISISPFPTEIFEIEIEKMEDRRFVVKITGKGDARVGGRILQMIESTGVEITYASLEKIGHQHILSKAFIRVTKQGRMTEDDLKEFFTGAAVRYGMTIHQEQI